MSKPICPRCLQPMHTYTQPGGGYFPDRDYAHCINKQCDLEGVTLEVGAHDLLTADTIAVYGESKRRLVAQRG